MTRYQHLSRYLSGFFCLWLLLCCGSRLYAAGDDVGPLAAEGMDRLSLSPAAREMLNRWGFVVTPECHYSIHGFYAMIHPDSPGASLPPLITTDALLHAYHVIFEEDIRRLEKQNAERLLAWQKFLWEACVRGSVSYLRTAQTERRLIGLVAVGRCLADPEWKPPDDVPLPPWVGEEVSKARKAEGVSESRAWERRANYAVFRPRGFYAQSAELSNYFRAWTWWSRFPLRLDNEEEMSIAEGLAELLDVNDTYRTLLSFGADLLNPPESPDIRDFARARSAVWAKTEGADIPFEARLSAAVALLKERFHPVIRTGYALQELSQPGELFGVYVFVPAYTFDSEVFTLTTEGPVLQHHWPGGLDLMAALDGPRIEEILMQQAQEDLRPALKTALQEARGRLAGNVRQSDVFELTQALWRTLLVPEVSPHHPPFMSTDAYRRKSLQTALAGWAEHRHRWILHIEPSSSAGGRICPPGFVEPNVPFWATLLGLTVVTRESLAKCGLAEDPRWPMLTSTVLRCRRIAEKQLKGQPLKPADVELFERFGDVLGELLGIGNSACTPDKPDSVVADVHFVTDPARMVHVGTGLAQAIYAVFPHEGKNWLCKGGVMTYREYIAEDGRVVTDEQWHAMLTSDRPPSQSEWTKDFCLPPEIEKREEP